MKFNKLAMKLSMELRLKSRRGFFWRGIPVRVMLVGISFSAICQERRINVQALNYVDTTGFGRRIDSLSDVALKRRYENIDMVLPLIDSALTLLKFAPNTYRYVISIGRKGIILFCHGRNKEAGLLLQEGYALAIENEFKRPIHRYPNLIANNEIQKGNYDLALYYQLKHLAYMLEENDPPGLLISHNNLGVIYYRLLDFDKARYHYKKALDYHTDSKVITLLNIALCYSAQNKFDSARQYIQKGIAECSPNCDASINFQYYLAQGDVHFRNEEFAQALPYYRKCVAIAREINNHQQEAESLNCLGATNCNLGNLDKAEVLLGQAKSLAKKNGYRMILVYTYDNLFDLYRKKSDYHNKAINGSKLISLWEEVLSDEVLNKISFLESEFSEQHHKLVIQKQRQELEIQNQMLSSRKYLSELLVLAGVLLLTVAFFLFRQNRISAKLNREIEMLVKLRTGSILNSFNHSVHVSGELNLKISALQSVIKYTTATLKGVVNIISEEDIIFISREELLTQVSELEVHGSEVGRLFKVF